MSRIAVFSCIAILIAGPAIPHGGVKDPLVMARMDAMMEIGRATKVLGEMAKEKTPFDADVALQAARAIADTSASLPALFETQATDPKSEANAEIWTNFNDFTAKSDNLVQVALAADISSVQALRESLGQIGKTCKSCHADYRLNQD